MPTSQTPNEIETTVRTPTTIENGTLVETSMKIKKPDGTFEVLNYAIDGNNQTPVLAPKEYFFKFTHLGFILSANVAGIKVVRLSPGLYRVTMPVHIPMNSFFIGQMHLFKDPRTHFIGIDQESTTDFVVVCNQDTQIGSTDNNTLVDSEVYILIKIPTILS